MTPAEREAVLDELEAMPAFLDEQFGALLPEAARRPGPGGAFSPVEQCWHLADLEVEGFGARIRRLAIEEDPVLPDFDGARIARERDSRSKALLPALRAFRKAREANLATLRALAEGDWARRGVLEGVGTLTLADVPRLMREHDRSHRAEIDEWLRAR